MGVPGFYSWLIKRYPLAKHMVDKQELPSIDNLYLDMNGIIYKCVKDDSIIFKSQILPKELEEIWLEVFNYINMIVNVLKPKKMIVMALDGVAPRSKMNNQRARRFKSARDHKKFMEQFYGFHGESDSQENFKNNSISPGTKFMEQLNKNLDFFIKKKIEEDDYWRSLSIIFTGSDSPGEGQHKIMEFIRANKHQFDDQDCHCLYGADADLIMLSLTLPLKNLCIIREEYVHASDRVRIIESKKEKNIKFEMIFVTILREYFEIEYGGLRQTMKEVEYDLQRIIADFVFLFFFIGNDFLPRCMAYNIRQSSIEDLITAFKKFLQTTKDYVVSPDRLNVRALALLARCIGEYEGKFIVEKSDDFANYLTNKTGFQNELEERMKMKMTKQHEFLNEIKALYMNQDGQAKSNFYESKFGVNPAHQSNQFYEILNYYLYGLQFVYEYYFVNLPSWQWYYPYYYAPLVTDLALYLEYLAESDFHFEKIVQGVPFEPFKQLLCILPKESVQLLPESFHNFITDKDSPLRSPFDFYPDEFEDDAYGSIRAHEFISLIPFLNHDIINQVYEKAIIGVAEEDYRRNKFSQSILYEYDEGANEIEIQSEFSLIPSVRCLIRENYVNLREEVKFRRPATKNFMDPKLYKMPSLTIRPFNSNVIVSRSKKSFVVRVIAAEEEERIKLSSEVFYGYPLEHSGQIEGILSYNSFQFTGGFDGYNYGLDYYSRDFQNPNFLKSRCKQAFENIKTGIRKQYEQQIDWQETKKLFFLKDTMQFVRCLDGSFKRVYGSDQQTTYTIVPAEIVSSKKIYESTRDNVRFNCLEEEFLLQENVLVFPDGKHENNQVIKGKVTGSTKNNKVKVEILQRIKTCDPKTLDNFIHTRNLYFSLKFVAFLSQIRADILLTLLDSINIVLNHPSLPPSIDIGLNFISRAQKKFVANLVRINFDEKIPEDNVQKSFSKLDISLRGVELILQYKQKFPEIVSFIEQRHERLIENRSEDGKINWREAIMLDSVYKEEEQSQKRIKSLMNIYFWLVKQEETHMPLSSIYSKQVSIKNIKKLQEYFREKPHNKKGKKYADPKVIEIDPNYVYSRRLAAIGKMHLPQAPKIATIKDEVVCLKPQFFGEYGVIVGFDGDKYQVLFKRPSFGKNDLNGICEKLWGGKFSERWLFNFQTWPQIMRERPHYKQKIKIDENTGWVNFKETNENQPKYKERSVSTFADFENLAAKGLISQKIVAFAEKAKKEKRVQKIDNDYIVVDTRKKDYEYKYDKGQSHIKKQYVQKIEKDKKYIEKPIQQALEEVELTVDYKKEIIENKVEEAPETTKAEGEKDEEEKDEDGDEMFANS